MTFALDGDPSSSEISGAINYLLANLNNGTPANAYTVSNNPTTGFISNSVGDIIQYQYRYLDIKYADNTAGLNFSDNPYGRLYFGIRNDDSSTESTVPADAALRVGTPPLCLSLDGAVHHVVDAGLVLGVLPLVGDEAPCLGGGQLAPVLPGCVVSHGSVFFRFTEGNAFPSVEWSPVAVEWSPVIVIYLRSLNTLRNFLFPPAGRKNPSARCSSVERPWPVRSIWPLAG